MEKEKFTPGPWTYCDETETIYAIGLHGDILASTPISKLSRTKFLNPEMTKANGILQATAPEMLYALRMLLNNYRAMGGKCGVEQASEVIARALGEA